MAESDGPGDAAGSGDRGGAPDTGIACLALLLRFHGMAADPAQLAHEYASASGGIDLLELTRAAREQGLKAGGRRLAPGRLDRAALPAIAEAADGGFFVLAKADGEKALAQRPGAPPETLARAALAARWTGRGAAHAGGEGPRQRPPPRRISAGSDAAYRSASRFRVVRYLPTVRSMVAAERADAAKWRVVSLVAVHSAGEPYQSMRRLQRRMANSSLIRSRGFPYRKKS